MSEIENKLGPSVEWEYKNFTCRLYVLGGLKTIGFVLIGDQWKQVVETEETDESVKKAVENEVQNIIDDVMGSDDDDDDGLPINPLPDKDRDPFPGIDPDPIPPKPPNPNPPNGPIWMGETRIGDFESKNI